jgi:hypothetical protein
VARPPVAPGSAAVAITRKPCDAMVIRHSPHARCEVPRIYRSLSAMTVSGFQSPAPFSIRSRRSRARPRAIFGRNINCRNFSLGTGSFPQNTVRSRVLSSMLVACYLAVAFKVSGPVLALKMFQEVARSLKGRHL